MAVAEMGVPTGFDADLESITKHDFIKKIETQDRKVIFYFDQVGNWKGIQRNPHRVVLAK